MPKQGKYVPDKIKGEALRKELAKVHRSGDLKQLGERLNCCVCAIPFLGYNWGSAKDHVNSKHNPSNSRTNQTSVFVLKESGGRFE